MVQKFSEKSGERRQWSAPVLEQLTVDLDAIASGKGNAGDGKSNNGS